MKIIVKLHGTKDTSGIPTFSFMHLRVQYMNHPPFQTRSQKLHKGKLEFDESVTLNYAPGKEEGDYVTVQLRSDSAMGRSVRIGSLMVPLAPAIMGSRMRQDFLFDPAGGSLDVSIERDTSKATKDGGNSQKDEAPQQEPNPVPTTQSLPVETEPPKRKVRMCEAGSQTDRINSESESLASIFQIKFDHDAPVSTISQAKPQHSTNAPLLKPNALYRHDAPEEQRGPSMVTPGIQAMRAMSAAFPNDDVEALMLYAQHLEKERDAVEKRLARTLIEQSRSAGRQLAQSTARSASSSVPADAPFLREGLNRDDYLYLAANYKSL